MAGLFGYLAAGAMQGVGSGMVENARALREQRMEELREQRLMAREDRAETRQTTRDQRQMDFQRERDDTQWSRQQQTGGQYTTDADGSMRRVFGDQVTTPKDETGNPINVGGRTAGLSSDENNQFKAIVQNNTEEVSTMPGFPPTKKTDWDAVRRQLRSASPGVYRKVFGPDDDQTPASGLPPGVTPEQVVEQAREAIAKGAPKEEIRKRLRDLGIDPDQVGL
jgi:hypothetical protein